MLPWYGGGSGVDANRLLIAGRDLATRGQRMESKRPCGLCSLPNVEVLQDVGDAKTERTERELR